MDTGNKIKFQSISDGYKLRKINNSHEERKLNQQPGIPTDNLRETDVGITEYVGNHTGFRGIVKSRYSDFHVNEIDTDGKVLHLDNLDVPMPKKKVLENSDVENVRKDLSDIINEETLERINTIINNEEEKTIEVDVTAVDKDRRRSIHELVKKLYGKKIISNTVNRDDQTKIISLKYDAKMQGDKRTRWDFHEGDYVHFLVYKENMDTGEVVSNLASNLKMRASLINFCGTKDKRAKTTQQFSIKRRQPSDIVNAKRHMNNVKIGNFSIKNYPLRLGMLKGNRFRIAIRHLEDDIERIDNCLKQIRDKGFINYFGLQRFGNNAAVPTYEVGIALLKSDYKLVCELILKPRSNDLPFLANIKELWWKDRDSAKALAMFPKYHKSIEKHIIEGLTHYGKNDYCAAIKKLSRNTLLMYPHAFQSLVFNLVISRRIKEFGFKILKGDLVYVDNEDDIPAIDDGELLPDTSGQENDQREVKKCFTKVKFIEDVDIEQEKFTIFDIVMPIPGFDITYPDNITASYYKEILNKYGITEDHLRHKIKSFAMPGAYRKMLVKPTDVSWKYVHFDSATESTLIQSDWDLLKGYDIDVKNEGKYRALILEFNLTSSVYATMLLREALRSDTSAAAQSILEKTANEKHDKPLACSSKRQILDDNDDSDAKTIKKPKID